jgi:transposase
VYYIVAMAMGKRRQQAKQALIWVATQDLPRSAAHPFYRRLNQILDSHAFERYVEGLCQQFYAEDVGRPGLPPGRYFRLLRPLAPSPHQVLANLT